MTKDPVCGMEISEAKAPAKLWYGGRPYHFCSTACKEVFEKHPQEYQDWMAVSRRDDRRRER